MKTRHAIVLALREAPDNTLELGEIYGKVQSTIKPEIASRMVSDNTDMPLDMRIAKGKISAIINILIDLITNGVAITVEGQREDLHRKYQLTEKGKTYKMVGRTKLGSLGEEVLIVRKELRQVFLECIANQPKTKDEIREVLLPAIPDNVALAMCRVDKDWPKDKKIYSGRNRLIADTFYLLTGRPRKVDKIVGEDGVERYTPTKINAEVPAGEQ